MKKVLVTEVIMCPYCKQLFCAKTGELVLEEQKTINTH